MYYSPDLSKSKRDHLIEKKNEEYIKVYKTSFVEFLTFVLCLNLFVGLFVCVLI